MNQIKLLSMFSLILQNQGGPFFNLQGKPKQSLFKMIIFLVLYVLRLFPISNPKPLSVLLPVLQLYWSMLKNI